MTLPWRPAPAPPREYRCHYCALSGPDPEAVFSHMMSGECRRRPAPAGRRGEAYNPTQREAVR